MNEIAIPRYVDSQPQLFFWELDEFVPFVFFVGMGIMTGALTAMLLPAFGITYVFARFKGNSLDGVLLHLGYWSGGMPMNSVFKNGAVRRYES